MIALSDTRNCIQFSSEYIDVLRDMGRDPVLAPQLRAALSSNGDDQLFIEVMPLPALWRSDDYALFCADRRVRLAEFDRRLAAAVEDWFTQSGRHRHAGLDSDTKLRLEGWVRTQLLGEIAAWLGRNPEVEYEE